MTTRWANYYGIVTTRNQKATQKGVISAAVLTNPKARRQLFSNPIADNMAANAIDDRRNWLNIAPKKLSDTKVYIVGNGKA